jgi:hypothetical protein
MSNYNGSINKRIVKINEKNIIKKLIILMGGIDSDYEVLAPIIVPRITKEKKTLKAKIEALLNFQYPTDSEVAQDEEFPESVFLLNNSTYCDGFDYEITPIKKGEVLLSLFYTA